MFVSLFGYFLAAAAAATSGAMMIMGGRFQKVEAAAYAGERRPWWFVLLSALGIGTYLAALVSFIRSKKNLAGWILMLLIPIGWAIKGLLVVFNAQGRQTVSSIEGDAAWRKVGLARMPVAVVLTVLAYLANPNRA